MAALAVYIDKKVRKQTYDFNNGIISDKGKLKNIKDLFIRKKNPFEGHKTVRPQSPLLLKSKDLIFKRQKSTNYKELITRSEVRTKEDHQSNFNNIISGYIHKRGDDIIDDSDECDHNNHYENEENNKFHNNNGNVDKNETKNDYDNHRDGDNNKKIIDNDDNNNEVNNNKNYEVNNNKKSITILDDDNNNEVNDNKNYEVNNNNISITILDDDNNNEVNNNKNYEVTTTTNNNKLITILDDDDVIEYIKPSNKILIESRRAPIPDEELRKVREFFNLTKYSHEILTDKFNIDMTEEKLSSLRPYTWLNDEVINFYMCMLQERDEKLCNKSNGDRLSSHFFNSLFMAKLLTNTNEQKFTGKYDYSQVKRWTKNVNVFLKNKIFIPLNYNQNHWMMIVVYIREREIHHYDSCGGSGIDKYLKHILRWLKDESNEKYANQYVINNKDWKLIDREANVPKQNNGCDCGMFAVLCADFLSDDLPLDDSYHQSEIIGYREKHCAAILRGYLPYPD
jgi:sentrin-specific protease 1